MCFNKATKPYKNLKFISANTPEFEGYEFYEKINEQWKKSEYDNNLEWIKIPCGQCTGCQESYSKEWACRCMLEAEQWKENYFITLTYDDLHIPCESEIVDQRTGEIYEDPGDWETGHLMPDDMTKFIKRLRSAWQRDPRYKHTGIRFYYCGEYGTQTERPHYHILLFNFPIEKKSLKIHRINKNNGTILWECKDIEEIWGKGFVTIAEVNWDTCAYTARYCMKKLKRKPREEYFKDGQIPEFVRMSRKPGIGAKAFNRNMFENDEIIIKGHKGKIQSIKPARYYDKLYDLENPRHMEKIKERRRNLAAANMQNKLSRTSLTEAEQLKMEEQQKLKVWKSLQRNQI